MESKFGRTMEHASAVGETLAKGLVGSFASLSAILAFAQFNLSPFVGIGLVAGAMAARRGGQVPTVVALGIAALGGLAFLDKTGSLGRAAVLLVGAGLVWRASRPLREEISEHTRSERVALATMPGWDAWCASRRESLLERRS